MSQVWLPCLSHTILALCHILSTLQYGILIAVRYDDKLFYLQAENDFFTEMKIFSHECNDIHTATLVLFPIKSDKKQSKAYQKPIFLVYLSLVFSINFFMLKAVNHG